MIGRRSKYSSVKSEVYGKKFDSKKEANRYIELRALLRNKEISELVTQPEFTLQDDFVLNNKKIRKIKYIADFMYVKDGEIIVEDVKGMKTDVYMLKKKMFLKIYGKRYNLVEI